MVLVISLTENNNGDVMQFYRSGNGKGSISVNNSNTQFNTSSDYRLKENIVDLTGAITRVKQLQPKRFNFIADPGATQDGFLAHEAATVLPWAANGTHNQVQLWGDYETDELPRVFLWVTPSWTTMGTQFLSCRAWITARSLHCSLLRYKKQSLRLKHLKLKMLTCLRVSLPLKVHNETPRPDDRR